METVIEEEMLDILNVVDIMTEGIRVIIEEADTATRIVEGMAGIKIVEEEGIIKTKRATGILDLDQGPLVIEITDGDDRSATLMMYLYILYPGLREGVCNVQNLCNRCNQVSQV
jgi:hypothetical protein